MSKAVLVIDMPESCAKCDLVSASPNVGETECCGLIEHLSCEVVCVDKYISNRADWCPLVPMPEKDNLYYHTDYYGAGYKDGWNDCIDAMGGNSNE